jgi:hypothetical protein
LIGRAHSGKKTIAA